MACDYEVLVLLMMVMTEICRRGRDVGGVEKLIGTPSNTKFDETPLPDSLAPDSSNHTTPRPLSLERSNARKLTFIEEADWNPDKRYEDPPLYICYSIEWKVTVKIGTMNSRKVSNDMELNVVLPPGLYWERCLKARLADLVEEKFSGNPNVRSDDTEVVVSMTGRSQQKLVKRFPGISIDWTIVQAHLAAWNQYLHSGKKLHVHLSFNYIKVGILAANVSGKRGDKRGRVSTTQRMRNESIHPPGFSHFSKTIGVFNVSFVSLLYALIEPIALYNTVL
jgi:hypothetical protein